MHSFIALVKKSNLQTTNTGTLLVDNKQVPQQNSSKLFPKLTETLTSVKRKDEIKAWIKANGLDAEVFKIAEPTTFNMLFITCTLKVAERLEHADAVVSVSRSPEFSVALTKP